jgi:hypothetical protein
MSKWRGKPASKVPWGILHYTRAGDAWRTTVEVPTEYVDKVKGIDNLLSQVASQQHWYHYTKGTQWVRYDLNQIFHVVLVDVFFFWHEVNEEEMEL